MYLSRTTGVSPFANDMSSDGSNSFVLTRAQFRLFSSLRVTISLVEESTIQIQ